MAQIAARAEFAVGTLYRFFSDKEALYQALILDSARQFEQALSAALDAPGDEVAKLECYLETKARLLVQYLPAARLYFAHAALAAYVPAAGLDQEVLGIFLSVRSRLEMVMTAAVRKKLLADVDPRLLMHAFEAISNGFLPALIEHPEDLSADQMAQVAKQVFFEPIRRNSRSK
jgi:AcrR family transcriptional regulator